MEELTKIFRALISTAVHEAVQTAFDSMPQRSIETERPLTIGDACKFAGCAESTIRKAFREKRLKGHRQAGRLYFFEEDIINWIKR